MPSVGLKSTTWNVPVPCGFVLIVAGGTWHGETSDPPEASSARNSGCARFRWKVASIVPSAVTLSRLLYQAARGLLRSFLPSRPATRSQVHFTSAAVKGSPSCHLRSEEHTSELQSLMRISYAVLCLKKKTLNYNTRTTQPAIKLDK